MYFQGVKGDSPTGSSEVRPTWRADHRMRFIDQVSADLGLPPNACRVAIALSRYVNSRTLMCWPTQKILAELVGLTERRIRSAIDALAAAGHLQVIQITDKRYEDQRRNGYLMIMKDVSGAPENVSDSGRQRPVNGGRQRPVNGGRQRPVNNIEDNLRESNHSPSPLACSPSSGIKAPAKIKATGDLSCFRPAGAFEGGRRVERLSSELCAMLGLPQSQPPPRADQGELPPAVAAE
jgi:Helix-turn-helix domain